MKTRVGKIASRLLRPGRRLYELRSGRGIEAAAMAPAFGGDFRLRAIEAENATVVPTVRQLRLAAAILGCRFEDLFRAQSSGRTLANLLLAMGDAERALWIVYDPAASGFPRQPEHFNDN